jgi:hypothetical protein
MPEIETALRSNLTGARHHPIVRRPLERPRPLKVICRDDIVRGVLLSHRYRPTNEAQRAILAATVVRFIARRSNRCSYYRLPMTPPNRFSESRPQEAKRRGDNAHAIFPALNCHP